MSPNSLIFFAIFLPIASVPLLAILGKYLKHQTSLLALCIPVISSASILYVANYLGWDQTHIFTWSWIPSFGINLSFLVDGLSILFGLIVSIMGVFIVFYARSYLGKKTVYQNRFYAYLMLFMGAMLGTVFSNNLLLLFIFWELTGIASFFLIGFTHQKEESRTGARMALIVTTGTGLMLLVGVVLININAGSYNLHELLFNPEIIHQNKDWMNIALVFMLLGAFGKSAQFPFHFWLPNAMAAPTPVSAYLHSATMVKLGIFLCARIYPLFSGTDYWTSILVPIGFLTLVIGSVLALLSNDLKAILANSTVAQLGFLIGWYGLGNVNGVEHDFFHILNHVFYKGALFMIAGIVDHSMGTRDIRKLGGLSKRMPLTAIACLITALSMAGFPGTMGFISKELMLERLLHSSGSGMLLLVGLIVAAICMVAFSIRLIRNIFFTNTPLPKNFHKANLAIQLPALLLASVTLLFGLFPGLIQGQLDEMLVIGLHLKTTSHLALWHGFNTPFLISLGIITCGTVLYIILQKQNWSSASIPGIMRFDRGYEAGFNFLLKHARTLTHALRGHKPFDYLYIIVCSFVAIMLFFFSFNTSAIYLSLSNFKITNDPIALFTFSVIIVGAFSTVIFNKWIRKLIALSITGFMITFYFMLYKAPDLALTQVIIETASLILVLLILTRLAKKDDEFNRKSTMGLAKQCFMISISFAMGLIMFFSLVFILYPESGQSIGSYFLENTVELAQGHNAVNTILVDFRGYDTMGEISVLVIAMLGVLGLLMRKKNIKQKQKV
jgi:NADH:ubiquinone oxidoreductase subunit 5 (subunit L)/multisubunit Na+/H+ antiporter MnhA subunit